MEKHILKYHLKRGHSTYEIAESEGVSQATVCRWLKKFKLKTVGRPGPKPKRRRIVGRLAFCLNCDRKLIHNQLKFCSYQCQHDFRYKNYIARWQIGLESGLQKDGSISKFIRRYLREKHKDQCCKCGWAEINPVTGKIPLESSHIDGDPYNTVESNLELLCPNCHALTPTYKGLNKGRGRFKRMQRFRVGKSF